MRVFGWRREWIVVVIVVAIVVAIVEIVEEQNPWLFAANGRVTVFIVIVAEVVVVVGVVDTRCYAATFRSVVRTN